MRDLLRRPELAALGPLSPSEAGRRLAALAPDYDLVLYECYLPDCRSSVDCQEGLACINGVCGLVPESLYCGWRKPVEIRG